MGSWSLSVHGHGIHDNAREGDIDKLAEQFVKDLRDKGGHVIDAVHLTVGSGRKYSFSPAATGSSTYVTTEYF